jgi:hypothetical protein
MQMGISRPSIWNVTIGAALAQSEKSSGGLLQRQGCHTSTHTASAKTLALLGEKRCRTPEEFKAWSQNLGHEKVLTTFANYGTLTHARQAEILGELWEPTCQDDEELHFALRLVRAARRPH